MPGQGELQFKQAVREGLDAKGGNTVFVKQMRNHYPILFLIHDIYLGAFFCGS